MEDGGSVEQAARGSGRNRYNYNTSNMDTKGLEQGCQTTARLAEWEK